MKNKIKLIILTLIMSVSLGLGSNAVVNSANKANVPNKVHVSAKETVNPALIEVNALDVVANPTKYLNKTIKIKAQFDKFTTLGLDYKPAFKDSEKHISFLIKRDDVINHTVPLSELKLFIKREVAEKYIDLAPGDIVEFSGVVFSNALGDAWVDVAQFKVLNSKTKETNKK